MNEEEATDAQKRLLFSLQRQKKVKVDDYDTLTKSMADTLIKSGLNGNNNTEPEPGIVNAIDAYNIISGKSTKPKLNISRDQQARCLSNIIATCWQSNRSTKENLDTIHTVFEDFKKVINNEHS